MTVRIPTSFTVNLSLFTLLIHLLHYTRVSSSSSSFEPYQLNGGLVSAVAGNDYSIVASDTRMMNGGYEIYTRRYLTSRIWSCSSDEHHGYCESDGSLKLPSSGTETTTSVASWPTTRGLLRRDVLPIVKLSKDW